MKKHQTLTITRKKDRSFECLKRSRNVVNRQLWIYDFFLGRKFPVAENDNVRDDVVMLMWHGVNILLFFLDKCKMCRPN